MAEWSIANGCNPFDLGLRGFESLSAHQQKKTPYGCLFLLVWVYSALMKKLITAVLMGVLSLGTVSPVFAQEYEGSVAAPVLEIPSEEVATSTESVLGTSTDSVLVPEEVATTSVLVLTTPEEPGIELIVKFNEDDANLNLRSGRIEMEEVAQAVDGSVEEKLIGANSAVISIDADANIDAAIATLEGNDSVEYVEPNYPRYIEAIATNDTLRGELWALENTGQSVNGTTGTAGADIDAINAWTLSLGTSTVVAVIDNGVLYTHADLADNLWDGTSCVSETGAALGNCNHGYDFANNDTSPLPAVSTSTNATHGTHVAGIIAAGMNNATGTIGVAPKAKIMALRFGLDVASEVKAIDFAIQNGAKIINASFGGTSYAQAEYDAIARFRDAGGIFIASAGNGGEDSIGDDNDGSTKMYPASYDLTNIVSVAATGQDDELAAFSNFGTTTVDIGAPGRRILSTVAASGTDPTYGYLSGTSMAAPHVAGVAALILSLYPSTALSVLKTALLSSGDSISALATKTVSGKRLNAYGALTYFTAPVITLIGDATISLTRGDTYTEQGATATDDTDVSVSVVIGGDTVDTGTVGTYTVTYNATDSNGNHATQVTRTVTVSAPAETPRRRGGGGGGGGRSSSNPERALHTTATSYASMTPEERTALLNVLLTLLAQLQAKLAALQAQGL